jgi:hypothetical protein
LDVDYWSFIFQITWFDESRQRGVFVKIPRFDWRNDSMSHAIADPIACNMGLTEFRSLSLLASLAQEIDDVKPIKALAYYPEWNAILTERVDAIDIYTLIRKSYLPFGMLVKENQTRSREWVYRLGAWLARIHNHTNYSWMSSVCTKEYASELMAFSIEIIERCSDVRRLERLINRISNYELSGTQAKVLNPEGFEIRNVILEHSTDNLYVLDPGDSKAVPIFESLAHFLVSLDILYWGSFLFLFRWKPNRTLEMSFLRGYFGDGKIPYEWLEFYKVKEFLKHWKDACVVLQEKNFNLLIYIFFRKFYVDGFYFREIENSLEHLEKMTSTSWR